MDMVTNVTNLSRSGLYDWMAQRVSAVLLAAYTIFLLGCLILNPGLTFEQWQGPFSHNVTRIFILRLQVALLVRCWRRLWTIPTDSLTRMAFGRLATVLRFLFEVACGLLMFVLFVWSVQILWGI